MTVATVTHQPSVGTRYSRQVPSGRLLQPQVEVLLQLARAPLRQLGADVRLGRRREELHGRHVWRLNPKPGPNIYVSSPDSGKAASSVCGVVVPTTTKTLSRYELHRSPRLRS